MSTAMKTENEVFKILRDSIILGLTTYGVYSGVSVRRFAQASFSNGDNLVLLHHIHTSRVGWQATSYEWRPTLSKEKRIDEWIDEETWQICALKKMQQNDTVNTITAEDIIYYIIAWFNGNGNKDLRSKGISNLPIDPSGVMVYNDDSDLYQRRPLFDMKIQVPRTLILDEPSLNVLKVESHPI